MARDISARRVFIASPGGLDDERRRLRETAVYNELNSFDNGVAFVACGWEPAAGTIDRPQAAINPLLRACDFMVMLIWDRWGSASGGSLGFSSGTEEEFAEAVQALSDADSTLRDILIIFKGVSGNQMRDPGPQLAKVLDFRSVLESSREVLFHTVDTMDELVTRFETGLRSWAKPLGVKESKVLKLQTRAPAVVQAAAAAATAMVPRDLLHHAESLAASGQLTQAEAVFSRAIDSRDPAILLRFARFLRRTGRLDRSYEIDHDVVDLTVLSREGEAKALGAEALANMGVVRRKQGKLLESRAHLREAVTTARAAGLPGRPVLGYAMDNLAWTDLRLGDFEDARRLFSDSLQLRRDASDKRGEAQSMINLARTEKMLNLHQEAADHLLAAIEVLDDGIDEPAHANALAILGEVRLAQGDHKAAESLLTNAHDINERIGNSDGTSVTSYMLAQCAIARDDNDRAAGYAERSRLESTQSSNQEGLALANRLLGEIDMHEQRWQQAIEHLTMAVGLSSQIGDPARDAAALVELAEALFKVGRVSEAHAVIERAEERAARTNVSGIDDKIARVVTLFSTG